ncbi:hypothetical protein Tco_0413139 [Tanacetum coccineum]
MSAHDDFSLHDDDELSLHDDASLAGSVPASNKGDAPAKPQQIITTNTLSNIKLPVLQKDDYDTWAMEMEHYLEYIDNEVWKVIQNGNSKKRVTKGKDGVYRVLPSTTQEEQFAEEKERKARTLLLMAIPKDHLRRFHGMDDAKEIWAAIKTRFGGNANSKKMQKAVLKQQFEAFTISSKESLEKGYDRFQKLLSQLDALGAGVSDEDANHKFLRSLPPAWDSLAMTMRTNSLYDYDYDKENGSDRLKDLEAYSYGTTLHNDTLPQKEKDPGSFTLRCYINNVYFEKALADLGASLIVMPFLTYTNLGLGKLAHTKLTVELANRNHRSLKTVLYNTSCRIGSLFSRRLHNSNLPKDVKEALDLGKTIFLWRIWMLTDMKEWEKLLLENHFAKLHHIQDSNTNEHCNKIPPLLKVSEQDKMNGISHSYQKLKGLSKGILDLGLEFIRDEKIVERIIRGHISMHELE